MHFHESQDLFIFPESNPALLDYPVKPDNDIAGDGSFGQDCLVKYRDTKSVFQSGILSMIRRLPRPDTSGLAMTDKIESLSISLYKREKLIPSFFKGGLGRIHEKRVYHIFYIEN